MEGIVIIFLLVSLLVSSRVLRTSQTQEVLATFNQELDEMVMIGDQELEEEEIKIEKDGLNISFIAGREERNPFKSLLKEESVQQADDRRDARRVQVVELKREKR